MKLSRIIGLIGIAVLVLARIFDFGQYTVSGLFTADSYYLPLREFVEEPRVRDMEDLVIDLHTRSEQRKAVIQGGIHLVALVAICVLLQDSRRVSRAPKLETALADREP